MGDNDRLQWQLQVHSKRLQGSLGKWRFLLWFPWGSADAYLCFPFLSITHSTISDSFVKDLESYPDDVETMKYEHEQQISVK